MLSRQLIRTSLRQAPLTRASLITRQFSSTRFVASPSPSHPVAAPSSTTTVASTERPEYQPHPSDAIKSWRHQFSDDDPERPRPAEDWVLSHPVYTPQEVNSVKVVHAPRKTFGDKFTSFLVAFSRKAFDFVTRYKEMTPEQRQAKMKELGKTDLTVEEMRKHGFIMTLDQWMARILFLETIAGVPGMVAGTLRHLRSLRRMERDRGFINMLLNEAENERMHLQTFVKIKSPSYFFRLIIIGAQGVFYNLFFLAYLISPRLAHRFVAYLEEEAVHTYTKCIEELERGHIPEWSPGQQQVPQIAKDYWRLPADATMLDLILAVRADEAGHRFINHTCANLGPSDFNPFAVRHATPEMVGTMPGVTREEGLEWMRKVEQELSDKMRTMAPRSSSSAPPKPAPATPTDASNQTTPPPASS